MDTNNKIAGHTGKSVSELEWENGLLRFLLNRCSDVVYAIDASHTIVVYNEQLEKAEKLRAGDVLGKKQSDVYGFTKIFKDMERETKFVQYSKETITDLFSEYETPNGERFYTLTNIIPYIVNDKVEAICTIGMEVNQAEERIIKTLELFDQNYKKFGVSGNGTKYSLNDIISQCETMRKTIYRATLSAKRDVPVMIVGESGTGKELFAQGIHNASTRCHKPFVSINCAAIPETLLESSLFGVEKGAFTGAISGPGIFEQAEGGTVFLDEINSMQYNLQPKLLRALQENAVRRVGGKKDIPINCRIISAMNSSPAEAIENQKLREDLFFRISTVQLNIPPLKERKGDVPLLTDYFIRKYNTRFGLFVEKIDDRLSSVIKKYEWPGNVRELENFVESSMTLVETGEKELTEDHLSDYFQNKFKISAETEERTLPQSMRFALAAYEKKLLLKSLRNNDYVITKVAADFGVTRQSIYRKIKKYGIEISEREKDKESL
ncbi:MAG: sigma-54 interaction domain-containing protein [Bacillota bacterium]|jgi:arginine utilization regulatory protein